MGEVETVVAIVGWVAAVNFTITSREWGPNETTGEPASASVYYVFVRNVLIAAAASLLFLIAFALLVEKTP